MNTSRISLNRLNPPQLGEALKAVRQGLEELGIDFFLVGAVARDFYLTQIHGQQVNRSTLDLDIAVLMSDQDEYEQLKSYLIQNHNFRETTTNAFALIHENGITLDLMPFGEIADARDWVKVEGRGMTSISVPGMLEAYEEAGILWSEEGDSWRVCTLAGMCILKLLSWQDRPESRSKDLQDLAYIIKHYSEIEQNELFDTHYDILTDEALQINSSHNSQKLSARLLGRHMQKIANRSDRLQKRLTRLLQPEPDAKIADDLGTAWAKINSITVEEAKNILRMLLQGLTDSY